MIPFGPFELENPLARGGSCDVWRGFHRAQGLPVAVKVGHLKRARTERFARSFREEVRAVAQLHHPGIVRVFDYGIISREAELASDGRLTSGSPFMVMEMAEATLLAFCGRISWEGLYRILMSVLDGLAHAHARGVIHRDIKPDNVLLVGSPARVRLADFGLAQPVDRDELPLGRHGLLGTPAYMAPEQFEQRWRDYWPWTDLYALGCTAFCLVCGHPPFGHTRDLEQMRDAHLTQEPPPFPEDVQAHIAPGFDEWVSRLLQKDPALRFRRAADAAWALKRIYDAALQDDAWLARNAATQPQMPFALAPGGTYALPFGAISTDEPLPGGAERGGGGPSLSSLQGVGHEPSFHPERHVDSLDEDEIVADSEETWVDSFGFAAAADEEDHHSNTPHDGRVASSEALPPFPSLWDDLALPQDDVRLDAVGVGLFGLRQVPLVGRERERQQLLDSLARVHTTRQAHVVVLSGPEGCGTSRLAGWLCARAHEAGVATYVKANHQEVWSETSGLGPMVSRYLRCPGLPRRAVEARLKRSLEAMRTDWGGASEDAIVLTEMISPAEQDDANDGEGSSITFSQGTERHTAVGRFLERLCGRRVAICWLDDVHWGLDALDFAHFFLSRQEEVSSPVLFVMTTQPEALSEREDESALLEGLLARDNVSHISLGMLEDSEQASLLQRLLPLQPELALEVERRTAGHPAFAIQLLQDWIERDVLTVEDGGFGVRDGEEAYFPDSLYQIWSERIERLLRHFHSNARLALELAAVLGHDVNALEWEMVCQEAGIGIDKSWVDALIERHLALCPSGDPGIGWSFVHGICREALESVAREEGRWKDHHRICAEVLHQRAGELLSFQASLPPSERPVGRPEMASRIGQHLLLSGQEKEALAPLLHGLWALVEAGEYRQTRRLLADWEALLEKLAIEDAHPFWGEAWLIHCRHARGQGRYEEAATWASKAAEHAREHNWERVLVRALMQLGYHSWFHSKGTNEGWRYLEEARSKAQACGDRWAVARCHRYMGDFLCYRGELSLALQHFTDAYEGFKSINARAGMGHACYGLATVERQAGRDEIALTHLKQATHLFASSGSRRGIADCLNARGDLLRHKGELTQARACYEESMEICRALGDGNLALSELNMALVLLAQGAFAEAREVLEHARDAFLRGGRSIFAGVSYLCLLPCVAAARDWDEWDTSIAKAHELLLQMGANDVDTANTAQLAGNLALKAGQFSRAREAYQIALVQWDGLGRQKEAEELIRALDGLPD